MLITLLATLWLIGLIHYSVVAGIYHVLNTKPRLRRDGRELLIALARRPGTFLDAQLGFQLVVEFVRVRPADRHPYARRSASPSLRPFL